MTVDMLAAIEAAQKKYCNRNKRREDKPAVQGVRLYDLDDKTDKELWERHCDKLNKKENDL